MPLFTHIPRIKKSSIYHGLIIGALILLSLSVEDSFAQCAMCRATVETAEQTKKDPTISNGLNQGILYLLSVPYLILASFGIWWYRRTKKEKQSA